MTGTESEADEPRADEPGVGEPASDTEPDRRELLVQSRVFLGIGLVVTVMAAIYITTAYEDAGSVMLVLAAGLSFICGGYLFVQLRRDPGDSAVVGHQEAQYLPHASIWPFWMGVAAFLLTNGLILGTWFLVPGGVVLAGAMCGFIRQSRARN